MSNIINLYHKSQDYFCRGISLKYLSFGTNAHAYMTGIATANFNPVCIQKNTEDLEKILLQSEDFYEQEKLFFSLVISEELCSKQTQNTLTSMGYTKIDTSVCMYFSLQDFSVQKSFDIKASDKNLSHWIVPLISAFESSEKVGLSYAKAHEHALNNKFNFYHFSLYIKEKPIASITLSINGTIARIDDVGTLPEFQRQGYATRLMNHVLSQAKKLGAEHCFLEASDAGLSIYQKLGFTALFKNNIYGKKI